VSGYSGRPMDLANMRANGVRALAVHCLDCTHGAEVNVDDQPHHLDVPSFAQRLRCSKCGSKNVHVMPAWSVKHGRIPGG
jgi:Zn finger protein HypA/HybF involved in hydrogenase expression